MFSEQDWEAAPRLRNSYAALPERFFERLSARPVASPKCVVLWETPWFDYVVHVNGRLEDRRWHLAALDRCTGCPHVPRWRLVRTLVDRPSQVENDMIDTCLRRRFCHGASRVFHDARTVILYQTIRHNIRPTESSYQTRPEREDRCPDIRERVCLGLPCSSAHHPSSAMKFIGYSGLLPAEDRGYNDRLVHADLQ